MAKVDELKLPSPRGFSILDREVLPPIYKISNTDWDAATKWMNNLAESVRYTRKVHGQKVLSDAEAVKFVDLWKRWLLFGNEIETLSRGVRDEGLASQLATAAFPGYQLARLAYLTAAGSLAMMSEDNRKKLDAFLAEAWKLYSHFLRLGMNQVAIPYMGELVVLLRSLPKEVPLGLMVQKLHEAAHAGERLVDQNTAWWQWRKRDETRPLRAAIAAATALAKEIASVELAVQKDVGAKEKAAGRAALLELLSRRTARPGKFTIASPSAALRDDFVRAVSRVYAEAASLYGVEETKAATRAEAVDEAKKGPQKFAKFALWHMALAGAGYLGFKWLTREKKEVVVKHEYLGYHPGNVLNNSERQVSQKEGT